MPKSTLLITKKKPALKHKSPKKLLETLDLEPGDEGVSEDRLFELLEQLTMATPKTAGSAFFNQLYGGRNMAAVSGEILAAVMNTSMYTFKVGGPQILVEQQVLRKMASFIGFPDDCEGTFTPGGSMSNFTAMSVGRNEADKTIRNAGLTGLKMAVYASASGHYSVRKNVGLLGIGRDNIRFIPGDERGRMNPDLLRREILRDKKAGILPGMVVCTAGTTVLGAFDPFEKIADIAAEFGIWMHVDGAFGGSVFISKKHRHLLKGAGRADSLSWNIHKMMNVPLTASAVFFRRSGLMAEHISEQADYLFQGDEDRLNPGLISIQCGRRNDALKVWASWKYLGTAGYEKQIDHLFDLARYAADYAKQSTDFELITEPESTTVCFNYREKSPESICDILDKRGLIKVGYGSAGGQTFIRLACINPDITFENLDRLFAQIRKVAPDAEPAENERSKVA